MQKLALLLGLGLILIGCGSELQVTNNPETPKPTQAQIDAMPPEAKKHAEEMDAYAKAQSEANKGRVGPGGR
jgi:hypothetical protein